MNADLSHLTSDVQKIESALGRDKNDSPIDDQCDSDDGYSVASSYQLHLTPAEHSFSIFEELTSESVDDDQLIVDELEPSLENALLLNKAYQSMLIDLSQQINVLRIINQERQKTLQADIVALTHEMENAKKPEKKKRRKKFSFSFFGMPYFKDADYNSCAPKNEDAMLAENIGFRNIALLNIYKPLTKYEMRKLRGSLKEQALSIEANRLMRQRQELHNQLSFLQSDYLSDESRRSIEGQIEVIQRQIFDINSCPEEKLFDIPATSFDWQKIAITIFQRSRTPDQLRLYWLHFMRPGVNTRNWLAAENRQLKELVKQYTDGVDWEEVATNLHTNRTAFECFRRYQERFNTDLRKFGWSKQDNIKLHKLISLYKDASVADINWEEVRQNFPGRSKTQIYAHFKYHTNAIDSNPFTSAEDVVILEGIKMGYDFADISLLLANRSTTQVRLRYKSIQNKYKGRDKAWTEKENNMLLNMKDTSELKHYVIFKDFPGRSFAQLFSRFHFLRMKSTDVRKYVEDLKTKHKQLPKGRLSRMVVNLLKQFGHGKKEDKNSILKTLPKLKKGLGVSQLRKNNRPRKTSNKSAQLGKELKEILRPLMSTNTKRPRKLSFPGDGREHGIILACLYRLLQCNFTHAPSSDATDEELGQLGIASQNRLAFTNLLSLMKDAAPASRPIADNIPCLPPTLNTLTGFRGLLLHRKYLQSSASCEYEPPVTTNRSTITECADQMEPVAGTSQASEMTDPSVSEAQNNAENEEAPGEEEEQTFGNDAADSLLFSRMLSLFYWPGIMSTMHLPDDLSQFGNKATEAEKTPQAAEESPVPPKKAKSIRMLKKDVKEKRRSHIQEVVRKRFGKAQTPTVVTITIGPEAGASTSGNGTAVVESASNQPPKILRTYQRKTAPKPASVAESDRVARTSGNQENPS